MDFDRNSAGSAFEAQDGADAFSQQPKRKKDKKLKSEKKSKKGGRHDKQLKVAGAADELEDADDADVDAAVMSAYDNVSQSGWDAHSQASRKSGLSRGGNGNPNGLPGLGAGRARQPAPLEKNHSIGSVSAGRGGSGIDLYGSAGNLHGSATQLEPPGVLGPGPDYSRNQNQYQNRTSELTGGGGMMDNTYTNAT